MVHQALPIFYWPHALASQLKGDCACAVVSNETPVSEPVIKTSAFLQATGEAKYTCDLPLPPGGGLEGAYVLSSKAAAKFELKWLPGRNLQAGSSSFSFKLNLHDVRWEKKRCIEQ